MHQNDVINAYDTWNDKIWETTSTTIHLLAYTLKDVRQGIHKIINNEYVELQMIQIEYKDMQAKCRNMNPKIVKVHTRENLQISKEYGRILRYRGQRQNMKKDG